MKSTASFIYRVGLGVFVKSLASFSHRTNATVVRVDDHYAYIVDNRYLNTSIEAEHTFPVCKEGHGLGVSLSREVFESDDAYLEHLNDLYQSQRTNTLAA